MTGDVDPHVAPWSATVTVTKLVVTPTLVIAAATVPVSDSSTTSKPGYGVDAPIFVAVVVADHERVVRPGARPHLAGRAGDSLLGPVGWPPGAARIGYSRGEGNQEATVTQPCSRSVESLSSHESSSHSMLTASVQDPGVSFITDIAAAPWNSYVAAPQPLLKSPAVEAPVSATQHAPAGASIRMVTTTSSVVQPTTAITTSASRTTAPARTRLGLIDSSTNGLDDEHRHVPVPLLLEHDHVDDAHRSGREQLAGPPVAFRQDDEAARYGVVRDERERFITGSLRSPREAVRPRLSA
jgi:hypothetical protein